VHEIMKALQLRPGEQQVRSDSTVGSMRKSALTCGFVLGEQTVHLRFLGDSNVRWLYEAFWALLARQFWALLARQYPGGRGGGEGRSPKHSVRRSELESGRTISGYVTALRLVNTLR
jgi:hypothetical protein